VSKREINFRQDLQQQQVSINIDVQEEPLEDDFKFKKTGDFGTMRDNQNQTSELKTVAALER